MEINQIIEEWRNEDVDALDYEGQQNKDSNRDLNMCKGTTLRSLR